MEPGPEVIKIRPERDATGTVLKSARIRLVLRAHVEAGADANDAESIAIPVASEFAALRPGEEINFIDARGSSRKILITARTGDHVQAECARTAYLSSGMELRRDAEPLLRIGRLAPLEKFIVLKKGDIVVLSDKVPHGRGPLMGPDGCKIGPATISCTIPEILPDIKADDQVWFDDGKIGGIIKSVADGEATIEITHASAVGSKLRANRALIYPTAT